MKRNKFGTQACQNKWLVKAVLEKLKQQRHKLKPTKKSNHKTLEVRLNYQ